MLRIGSYFFFQSTCSATKHSLAIVNDLPISPLENDAKKYIKIFNKFNLNTVIRAFNIFRGKRNVEDQNMISEWSSMNQDEKEVFKYKKIEFI